MLDGRLQHALLRSFAAERAAGIPELTQRDVAEAALAHALAQLPVEDVEARAGRAGRAVVRERDRRVLARTLCGDEREGGLAHELVLRARVDRERRDAGRQGRADEMLRGGPAESGGGPGAGASPA